MSARPDACPHEADILDLIAIGQWPDRAGADLAAHVASCPACADLALVASSIIDVRDSGASARRLPDAGIVWLRAQMRARADARRRAARPFLFAQVAGAAALAAILAIWWGGLMGTVTALVANGWTAALDLFGRQATALTAATPAHDATTAAPGAPWLIPGVVAATLAVVALAFALSRLADDEREFDR